METVYVVLAAFILDLIFGDPSWIPHPVVIIGKLISGLERLLDRGKTPRIKMLSGVLLTVITIGVSSAIPLVILMLLRIIDIRLCLVLETFWAWQIFACRSLKEASMRVHTAIEKNDIEGSRKALAMIVGRDTNDLSFSGIIKAVIETVAENASDGVIAPMFYMVIGGVPLGFFYKAGNTLDSMVGYKNEKYLYFGRCSALFDDVLNFIPSRITALLMIPAAAVSGLDSKGALRIFFRDRKKHLSPNAGNPESACAGALGVQLGGDAYYFGRRIEKTALGDDNRSVENQDIVRTNKLMITASFLALILMLAFRSAIIYIY